MSRVKFKTGKQHQERTAIWARQRLADGCFSSPDDQDGVLLADSVGMGKTWEALGAAALLLYKIRPKHGRRHVLILCPANLVTKWEDELAAGSPFRQRLDAWARRLEKNGQTATARRVIETPTHLLPIRSAKHVPTHLKHGHFHPPGGTYIVSQSLITRQASGLSALRREEWDVVIVDEAHNAAARKALASLQSPRRAHTKLLLTATPFQLEPRQWNLLARNLLKRSQKVLNHVDVAGYIEALTKVFESSKVPGPTRAIVEAASEVLRLLVARSYPKVSNRRYRLLLLDGSEKPLHARLDELDDGRVQALLGELRRANESVRDFDFEADYFKQRFRLATRDDRTYVATRLRRLLATGTGDHPSPRREALKKWAQRTFEFDVCRTIDTGLPQKTIVFTAWVGDVNRGEAAGLRKLLQDAFDPALSSVRERYGRRWFRWIETGRARIEKAASATSSKIAEALQAVGTDELTAVLAGKHRGFVARLRRAREKWDKAITEARRELDDLQDPFEARALRRRVRDMQSALSPWTNGRMLSVERYTGNERRSARDRVATAFRELGPPYVLVASNVGAEGIDLHTYTARIVHYDLEWNPAKMEQREGRGDRVGRRLKDKLEILYCLVPRTYDERMFHQLVARDRWHGVLLGKPAGQLEDDLTDAPLIDRKRLKRMRLDLAPR